MLSSPEALEEKGVSGHLGSPRSDPCLPRGCGDRCLSVRLGRSLAVQDHQGQMEHTAQVGTYKCARAQSNVSRTAILSSGIEGAARSCPHRQHLSSVPHKSSGWHQVQAGSAGVRAAPYMGFSPLPEPQGRTPPRRTEHCGGCSLTPRAATGRLETPPRGGGKDLEPIWQSRGGRFCLRNIHTLSSLVLTDGGDQPSGTGCLGSCLASQPFICLSSNSAHSCDAGKSATGRPQIATGGPQLARAAMVSGAAEITPRGAMAPPKETGPSLAAGGTHMANPRGYGKETNPDRLQLWVWPLGTRTHSWHPVTSQ